MLPTDPDVADLLAVLAYRASPTTEAADSLTKAIAQPTARTLTGHAGAVWAVAYSPDGKHLATAGDDNDVRVWVGAGMSPPQAIGFICDWLRRDLTPNERKRYQLSDYASSPPCPAPIFNASDRSDRPGSVM